MSSMNTLIAIVRDGHITLNEPTELAEGTVIELHPVSSQIEELRRQIEGEGELLVEHIDPEDPENHGKIINLADEMAPEELARFKESLKISLAEEEAGLSVPAEEVLQRLRAK